MRRRATIVGSLGIWHVTAWIVLSVTDAANQVTLHGIVPFLLEHPLLSGADLPAALIQVKWSATTAIKEATKARNASRLYIWAFSMMSLELVFLYIFFIVFFKTVPSYKKWLELRTVQPSNNFFLLASNVFLSWRCRLWFAIIVAVEDILLLNVHQPLLLLEEEEDHDVGDQFCTVFRKWSLNKVDASFCFNVEDCC